MFKRTGLILLLALSVILAAPTYAGFRLGCEGCERSYDTAECVREGPGNWANCETRLICWCFSQYDCVCQYDCGGERCYQI